MAAKFISNQRGGHKLIHEGHSYIKHRHRSTPVGEVTYWRCDQLHRLKCPGFAQTNSRSDEVVEAGQTDRAVSEQFNISNSTVSRVYARHRQTGDVSTKPKSGRLRKTSEWQDRAIARHLKLDPNKSASEVAALARGTFGVTRSHSHAPSSTRIEVLIAKSDIRRAAVNAISATPGAIVANALEGISDAAKHQLPKIANLKKTATRQRKSIGDGAADNPMPSRETLRKRLVQNYRRNAWGGATANPSNGSHRRTTVTVPKPQTSHYVSSADPTLSMKQSQMATISSAALDVVLKESLPLNFIERPSMRSLLKAVLELGKMSPGTSLVDSLPDELALRMEMRKRIAKARNSADFKQFIELLKSGGCLSYAFDESGGKSVVTIKGHALNEQFELLNATFVFKEYSGEKLRDALTMEMGRCLSEQLGFSPTEMAKMHHVIADGTIEVPFESARLRHVCLCDVLNNVIEHTTCPYADSQLHNRRHTVQRLNELNKLIGRVRVIVFWICEHFGGAVSLCPSVQLRLFLPTADNRRRRFASTVTMLSSFVSQLEEVDAVLRNSERSGGGGAEMAAQMRKELEHICAHKEDLEAYLMATEPIVEWIEFFEESDQPTIHRALPALAGIENGLNTLRMLAIQSCDGDGTTNNGQTMPNSAVLQRELCEAALDALDWNISPLRGAKVNKHLLCTAAALDPSAWRRELPAVFAKVARWTEEEMIAELRISFAHAILSKSHRQQMQQQKHKMPRRSVLPSKRPLFSCAVEAEGEGNEREEDEQRDEVAEFVTVAKQYRHTTTNSSINFDLLSYWNNDLASLTFSNLRALARQILCVPGGHIGTERIFSVQNVKQKLAEEDKFEGNEAEVPPRCSANTSALSFVSSVGSAAADENGRTNINDAYDDDDDDADGDAFHFPQQNVPTIEWEQQQKQNVFKDEKTDVGRN
ncbi:hypothetical protein niasHT_039528 [Heterodera trifolii]|uniref:HAT C-terminal dimerisation domain-containing protein n=1 Tax=Heterodera trifolii TaxID=157864 RepID=A0ABD2I1P6_9BILA